MYKKRAKRRWRTRQKLKSAMLLVQIRWRWNDQKHTKKELRIAAAYIRDNMKDCSCALCCNPRHSRWNSLQNQLTIQERRNLIKYKSDYETYC